MHGRLRDAVHVDETRPIVTEAVEPRAERGRLERLAPEDDHPQGQSIGDREELVERGEEQARGCVEHGHPLRTRSSRSADGERVVHWGTITKRPPYSNAPQISQTEKSKAYECSSDHVSSGPNPNQ